MKFAFVNRVLNRPKIPASSIVPKLKLLYAIFTLTIFALYPFDPNDFRCGRTLLKFIEIYGKAALIDQAAGKLIKPVSFSIAANASESE